VLQQLRKVNLRINFKAIKNLFSLLTGRENSPYIIKYNLKTDQQEAQITISGFTPRKNSYQWNGNTAVDLAVDEQGLWVLWGDTDNSYRLYASKIDVYKNVVTDTYALATGKATIVY